MTESQTWALWSQIVSKLAPYNMYFLAHWMNASLLVQVSTATFSDGLYSFNWLEQAKKIFVPGCGGGSGIGLEDEN